MRRHHNLRSESALGRTAARHLALALLLCSVLAPYLSACRGDGARGGASAGASGEAKPGTGERRILFYRNPMNPAVTSPTPAKDAMGMEYLPVYADEAAPAPAGSAAPGRAAVTVPAAGLALAGVVTAPAVVGELARSTRTPGIVVADETRIQHFHTRISGWVERLAVNFTGQPVRAGQTLLTVYSPELLATEEEYLRARDTAARFATSSLPEVRRGGEDLAAAARRRLELFGVPPSFVAELDRTGKARRAVPLLAPMSGYVTAKQIFAGQQVDPSMELYTITDLSRVWVEADFYEYEAQAVRLGQEARLALPYDPGVQLAGRIAFVYPTLSPESRTLKVRIEVPNRGLVLKPGMYVDVSVGLDRQRGVIIPDSAVLDSGLRQIVFVEIGGGRFEPREARIGLRADGRALVLAGVAAGERVATRANFLLDSESQLRAAVEAAVAKAAPQGREGTRP